MKEFPMGEKSPDRLHKILTNQLLALKDSSPSRLKTNVRMRNQKRMIRNASNKSRNFSFTWKFW